MLNQLWAACESILPCPYVFGGRDQARQGGLDCSGYVLEALHRVGIDLTAGQPYDTGKWLINVERIVQQCEEVQQARPGDLIIFEHTYQNDDGSWEPYSHVGVIKEPWPSALMYDCEEPEAGLHNYGDDYWQAHVKMAVRVPGLITTPPLVDSPWTAEQIVAVTGAPLSHVAENWPRLLRELQAVGQASTASLAAAIGTAAIETVSTFQPVVEAFWLSDAGRWAWYADTSQHAPYSGGPNYFGRGFPQITHDYNYRAAGDALGIDLVGNPDLALDPDVSAKIFAWFWSQHDLQTLADASDWATLRQRFQGGTNGLDRLISIVGALL
jgi:hypothetical protein